ncbi:MAG: hypothetical protein A2514_15710 [Gammaproteobacteria bacterium RIFOXYD12_FULL_61_37]|nr:MAG: hypothetical protein A2514_15710 [Gammaproteobacteria bacterium RIFOXYD12_FULL_61_37]
MEPHVNPGITIEGLRNAVLRLREGDDALRKHREFVEGGGEIRWVVDPDVVHLFLNPKKNARYADVFPLSAGTEPSSGLVGLTALLADFLFSKRFNLGGMAANSDDAHRRCKLVLEPHTDELDEAIRSIARKSAADAHRARGAVAGRLEREIRDLLETFSVGESNEDFIKRLLKTIERRISLILPDGPFQELKRASDLLKKREAIEYQADVADLHAMISTEEFEEGVDGKTDIWCGRLRDFISEHDRSNTGTERESYRFNEAKRIRISRDARVLAKLDGLNRKGAESKVRYVMITGAGLLHCITQEIFRKRPPTVHLLKPSAFLGNPRLFEVEGIKTTEDQGSRWMRMTQAVNLLGTRFDSEQGEFKKHIAELIENWEALQRMALPYLPSQSTETTLRAVAKEIFQGKPLEALETQLYIALSEFFVVTAELGLLTHQESAPMAIKRKPPPLRLAFYPQAENLVLALIDRRIWNDGGGAKVEEIAGLIEAVKKEQQETSKSGNDPFFNYPLLLCLASRFAILGDWHASRVLAMHAKAVAKVAEHSLPCVTGREAALLESYSRRLDAKSANDLNRAREVLQEFREAVKRDDLARLSRTHDLK